VPGVEDSQLPPITFHVAYVDKSQAGGIARLRSELRPLEPSATSTWQLTKRVMDVSLAVLLLLAMSPALLLIALAIKLDSRGPVIFRQKRFGRNLDEFAVLKFRTMVPDADPEVHKQYIAQLMSGEETGEQDEGLKKLTADPRVTRVGRFLRKTSLDELPQLANVLLGQMSLVGPRPALDYELEHYAPSHFERFTVRPGLTGLWQVSGRSQLGFGEMLDLDAAYARRTGPVMDLQILAKTPITLVRRTAA
jgi:lipopolysaccharide/colanic/teichoic acid biosynthesis glycosyltransferase